MAQSRLGQMVMNAFRRSNGGDSVDERSPIVPTTPAPDEHNAYISEPLQLMGVYDTRFGDGILDRSGMTMEALRNMTQRFTPTNAITSTRVNQTVRFCERGSSSRYGVIEKPSFRIRLRDRDESPTHEDRLNMRAWEDFFENAGWCPPPEEERPLGWQRGLDYIMKGMVRDSLTLDFVPFKKFAQKGQEAQFPIVAFTLDDGARYRNVVGEKTYDPATGRVKIIPWDGKRTNTGKRVTRLVRLDGDSGFTPISEYTSAEVSMFIRNPRLDERAVGYGYPESEQATMSILDSLRIRDYNTGKFTKNHVPRGFFKMIGNPSQTAVRQFENRLLQMMTASQWALPILQIPAANQGQTQTDINWVDIGLPNAEGEYSQLAYTLLSEIHAAYHISLEETGLAAASPFTGGLSENDPATEIEHSQSHLVNLMVDVSVFFNREILWKSLGGKRYQFEWIGLEERDYMAEEELVGAMLANGTVNLRSLYKYRDQPLPDMIKDSPAVDLPGPFMQVLQYLDAKEQMQVQQDMAERQGADQEAQQEAEYRKVRKPGDSPSTVPQSASQNPSGGDSSDPAAQMGQPPQPDDNAPMMPSQDSPSGGRQFTIHRGEDDAPGGV